MKFNFYLFFLHIQIIFIICKWEKHQYPQFLNLSDADFSSTYLGLEMSDLSNYFQPKNYTIFTSLNLLPETFDARILWPNCIHSITNQFYCGSCYALSSASVLSDRLCIASRESINEVLSPQYIISCNEWTDGCYGGGLLSTWWFLEEYGTYTDNCIPYLSFMGDDIPCNFNECFDNSTPMRYFAKQKSTHIFYNKDSMKVDVMTNGPIQVGFWIYGDFKEYKQGVYAPENRTIVGAHAAKLVGWGIEDGIEYWIVGNSWGNDWGENGYFRIKTGECSLEKNAIVGLPDLYREENVKDEKTVFNIKRSI